MSVLFELAMSKQKEKNFPIKHKLYMLLFYITFRISSSVTEQNRTKTTTAMMLNSSEPSFPGYLYSAIHSLNSAHLEKHLPANLHVVGPDLEAGVGTVRAGESKDLYI